MNSSRFNCNVDHSVKTEASRVQRVEVITGVERRREWTDEKKLAIIAESCQDGVVISDVARRHGLRPQQLFNWRNEFRKRNAGGLPCGLTPAVGRDSGEPAFAPVMIAADRPAAEPVEAPAAATGSAPDRNRAWLRNRPSAWWRRQQSAGGCSACREGHHMIVPPTNVRVLIATKPVDFRKGALGLAAIVETEFKADPFSGVVYVFRSKRADRIKLLFWDGTGICLLIKRLEDRKFCWPRIEDGVMRLSPAQLSALLEGLDWTRVHAPRVMRPRATQ